MSSSYTSLPAKQIYHAASGVLDSYNLDFVGDDTERVFVRNILQGIVELSQASMAAHGAGATVEVSARDFRHFSSIYFKQAEQAENQKNEVWSKLT